MMFTNRTLIDYKYIGMDHNRISKSFLRYDNSLLRKKNEHCFLKIIFSRKSVNDEGAIKDIHIFCSTFGVLNDV